MGFYTYKRLRFIFKTFL